MGLSVCPLNPDDLDAEGTRLLVEGSPYLQHRHFNREELFRIALADFSRRMNAEVGVAYSILLDGHVAGICCCSRVSWDSNYFGMPMARLECWMSPHVTTDVVVSAMKGALEGLARTFDYRHVFCRVGQGDFGVFNAATSLGFALVDVQRVYVARGSPGRGRSIFPSRPYVAGDRGSLMKLFRDIHFESRYTRDPLLPSEKVGELYVQWITNMLDLPEADREIYVLERNGEVVAAGAGRYVDFSDAGVNKRMMTDGIFAGRKGYAGSYVGITKSVVGAAMAQGCRVAELKVSANNYPANRVLQSLGYEGVMQSFAFHRAF